MKILDAFAGLGGWGAPFAERGHEVISVDIEERFNPTIVADVLTLKPADLPGPFDAFLASPPCEVLSVGGHFAHWLPGYKPADEASWTAMALVRWTVKAIAHWRPAFYVVENPVGMLRKLHILPFEQRTVWYCHYGDVSAKPTDLWGGFPPSLHLRMRCHNAKPWHSPTCCCRDHEAAPRGSSSGTQGKGNAAERAVIPRHLSLAVCEAAERDLAAGVRAEEFSGRLFA